MTWQLLTGAHQFVRNTSSGLVKWSVSHWKAFCRGIDVLFMPRHIDSNRLIGKSGVEEKKKKRLRGKEEGARVSWQSGRYRGSFQPFDMIVQKWPGELPTL